MIETFIEKLKKDNIKIFNFEELEIGRTLGEGANGIVYRCNYMNKRYAAKKIHKNHVLNNNEYKYFLNDIHYEIQTGNKFNSKRIMKIYGFCYDKNNEEVYIILELLNNKGCLFDYIYKMNNVFDKSDKIKIFLSIVLAVKDMHDKNYCHSDLKLENLVYFLDFKEKNKYVKLIDFNCVTNIKYDNEDIDYTYGTYGYCAPEQIGNNKYVCLKSDIYSLGIIFLELIMDNELWDTNFYSHQKYRKSVLQNLKELQEEDYEIYEIIKKCISLTPEKRYDIYELYNIVKKLSNDYI
jgi:serine/threonine protein kinase